jgi:hypothetical protein
MYFKGFNVLIVLSKAHKISPTNTAARFSDQSSENLLLYRSSPIVPVEFRDDRRHVENQSFFHFFQGYSLWCFLAAKMSTTEQVVVELRDDSLRREKSFEPIGTTVAGNWPSL